MNTLINIYIPFDRIMIVTSDNISNNKTMIKYIGDALRILDGILLKISRVPYLVYVIQLIVGAIISYIKITPRNNMIINEWYIDEKY